MKAAGRGRLGAVKQLGMNESADIGGTKELREVSVSSWKLLMTSVPESVTVMSLIISIDGGSDPHSAISRPSDCKEND